MTTAPKKPESTKKPNTKTAPQPNKELETDMPLSEKDEVKRAEQNTGKPAQKST